MASGDRATLVDLAFSSVPAAGPVRRNLCLPLCTSKMLATGRIELAARGQRQALSGLLAAGRIARLSRPAPRVQRIARRWAHCASPFQRYAPCVLLTAGRIAPLPSIAMGHADCSPLGALRLSLQALCALRIAHRWSHFASPFQRYAPCGLLTAGRIAPLPSSAMRPTDCSRLGALPVSYGQRQRNAHPFLAITQPRHSLSLSPLSPPSPSPPVLGQGLPIRFDTWLDDLQLYLLSDCRDSVSLFDHTSGASLAPPATGDSATRSQWLTRDAAARLAICNHLPLAECTHFG
ncbi:unnamed protein product [Closterium sp. NIES-53]